MHGPKCGLWMQRIRNGLARLLIKSKDGNLDLTGSFAPTAMKKIPRTSILAGAAHKSSKLFSVRRDVLRGIVAHYLFCGLPIMLRGTKATAASPATTAVCICVGDELARYGFGDGHPLGVDRQAAFL